MTDFVYRFEYADRSAFEIQLDGRAFITFPDGRREEKFGKITNNIPQINTPHTTDWIQGVKLEAFHQVERYGVMHNAGKSPFDWFWLIGYLAQKAAASEVAGDINKAKHHTISTGAALLNWHRHLTGESTSMRPGIADPELS
jgi:hypothetical protein